MRGFTRTLFGKLMVSYLAVISMTLLIVGGSISYAFKQYAIRAKEGELLAKAKRIAALAEQMPWLVAGPAPVEILDAFDRLAGAQVWLVGPDAVIRSTSPKDAQWRGRKLSPVQVSQLLTQEPTIAYDPSPRPGRPTVIRVSVPVTTPDGRPVGAMILSAPIANVLPLVGKVNELIIYAGLLGVLCAAVIGFFLSKRISRPLGEMTGIAQDMARGEFRRRVHVTSDDEVGRLAGAFNHLAQELGRTVDALGEEKSRTDSMLASMAEGVIGVDAAGRVLLLNPSAEMLLGLPDGDDRTGQPLAELGNRAVAECFARTLDDGQVTKEEFDAGGRRLWVQVAPIRTGSGGLAGAVGILRDTSEAWRLEQMRRDFVANVSHELRTPLTSIRGFLQAIDEGVVQEPGAVRRYVKVMLQETLRLIRLTHTLLDLSRLTGTTRLAVAPVPVALAIEGALASLEPRIEEKKLGVQVDVPADLPPALADRDRLNQILINLLDNAIRFTPPGGRIAVRAQAGREGLLVSVQDTGAGIAPEDLPHIWERFYKADKSRRGGGTGLGLVIVKELVEKHGGAVEAQSRPGQGSLFRFSLPAAAPA